MLTWLKQYLPAPDKHLNNSYRFVILRQAITWIGTEMEIHNLLKFWAQTRKLQDRQDSKIAYSINGPWYFNKTNTFSSFEDESRAFNLMERWLTWCCQVCINFKFQVFDIYLTQLVGYRFHSQFLKSPSYFFTLDLIKIYHFCFLNWVKLFASACSVFFSQFYG